jgi:hypothetical protein
VEALGIRIQAPPSQEPSMVRSRALGVLSDLCLALGLGTVSSGSSASAAARSDAVAKTAQTLQFTSQPPTDAIVNFRWAYVVTAESSSGLPVVLTADPNTPACHVDDGPFPYGNVWADHAGPSTVFADQPGNDEYLPADRISMTFDIARELTFLDASDASKGVLGITPTTFKANLRLRGWWGPSYGAAEPFAGQQVSFYVGGKLMCSATTVLVDDGTFFGAAIASCKAAIGLRAALKDDSYTATYAGNQDYLPSTAVGKLGG